MFSYVIIFDAMVRPPGWLSNCTAARAWSISTLSLGIMTMASFLGLFEIPTAENRLSADSGSFAVEIWNNPKTKAVVTIPALPLSSPHFERSAWDSCLYQCGIRRVRFMVLLFSHQLPRRTVRYFCMVHLLQLPFKEWCSYMQKRNDLWLSSDS